MGGEKISGLLHAWFAADCSLFANALVYSPPRVPRAFPRPGRVGGTSHSMTLVSGPPVPSSEAALTVGTMRAPRWHERRCRSAHGLILQVPLHLLSVGGTDR